MKFVRALVWILASLDAAHSIAAAQTPDAAPQSPPAAALTDERLREAWGYLLPSEQIDAAVYLRDALKYRGTFQQGLIDFALSLEARDLGQLPVAPPTPFYAPEIHAPRQPIARDRMEPEDPRCVKQRALLLANVPKTGLDSAWRYDWASGEVQRTGNDRDPSRLFFNALAGFPPDLDIAQALIERALDDGEQRKVHRALAHAYTDRAGKVYPGLTLYDAWSSGREMEMPDVDVLGVLHDLANDWKTWIAPVPDSQHDELYARVFVFFHDAKRHRGLRTALAMTFGSGSIALRDGYIGHRDRMHSWWDEHSSTPAEIAKALPTVDASAEFLEGWSERIDGDALATQRGQVRRATLDQDAAQVRTTAIAILGELGALARKERPPLPSPPPAPPEPPKRDK